MKRNSVISTKNTKNRGSIITTTSTKSITTNTNTNTSTSTYSNIRFDSNTTNTTNTTDTSNTTSDTTTTPTIDIESRKHNHKNIISIIAKKAMTADDRELLGISVSLYYNVIIIIIIIIKINVFLRNQIDYARILIDCLLFLVIL